MRYNKSGRKKKCIVINEEKSRCIKVRETGTKEAVVVVTVV